MKYPDFLKQDDIVGVCALSAGVGKDIDEYEASLSLIKDNKLKVIETASVRSLEERSNTPIVRAKELDELITNDNIKMIMCAAGGDSQIETVPYINYENISKHPKWIMGASDPTNLLYIVTTKLDIATLYGLNAKSYSGREKIEIENNMNILFGNNITQNSSNKYLDFIDVINQNQNYKNTVWKANNDLSISGRCIGGCLDCISKIIGTEYDYTKQFLEKYKEDGIVWYLDIFSLSAYDTYLTLLQMKYAGFFNNCKGVLIGRVAFPNENSSNLIQTYDEAYKLALDDIPYISEMDIGHTHPSFTIINGAIINVGYSKGKGSISFLLK